MLRTRILARCQSQFSQEKLFQEMSGAVREKQSYGKTQHL